MRTNCGKILFAGLALASAEAFAVLPVVTSCEMSQPGGVGDVTVKYKFTGADAAVITLDVQTNAAGGAWASIGGEAICNAQGEVWKKVARVSDDTEHVITWRPSRTWKDADGNGYRITAGGARAVVTAWALDNTPNYMVVDVSMAAQPNTQRYYPAVDFLPGSTPGQRGAITNNAIYRTHQMLMRKIMAKDITWAMGSSLESGRATDGREDVHLVTLTNNFYIGVFPVTQTQWADVATNSGAVAAFTEPEWKPMRPMERVSYNEIRNTFSTSSSSSTKPAANTSHDWPNGPNPSSFLGLLRAKTGLDFDLPSESQWEFACRAGNGEGKWGDGSTIVLTSESGASGTAYDASLDRLGRYPYSKIARDDVPSDLSTAPVGCFAPNSWGLYDMHGNVWEFCLDWYATDIGALCGEVNVSMSDSTQPRTDTTPTYRVARGGCFNQSAYANRSAQRTGQTPNSRNNNYGFRVVCRGGLQ